MQTSRKIASTRQISLSLLVFLYAGCASTTPNQSTPNQLPTNNIGLTALTATELDETFTGKSFVESSTGDWTWDFDTDGLAHAKAINGDWAHLDQKWSIEGDKLCRSLKDEYPCVEIYRVDDNILFGKTDSDSLETWAIQAKGY